MRNGRLRLMLCAGICSAVLAGCSAHEDTEVTESVTESVTAVEEVTETSEIETVKPADEPVNEPAAGQEKESESTSEPQKEYMNDLFSDYDGDGETDKVYRMKGAHTSDFYIELTSAGELYLDAYCDNYSDAYKISNADLDGDGSDEIIFSVTHLTADGVTKSRLYVYTMKDGEYVEFPLPIMDEGHEFAISRDLTRAQITCDDTGFSYTMWSTLKEMQSLYFFYQGTEKRAHTPISTRLCEYDGEPAICCHYTFGNVREAVVEIEEIVTYKGGVEKTVAMYSEYDNDATKLMMEKYDTEDWADLQYEYDMGSDIVYYDMYNYIESLGMDYPYYISAYFDEKDGEYTANHMTIMIGDNVVDEEECEKIMELTKNVAEKFGIVHYSVSPYSIMYTAKLAQARRECASGAEDENVPEWILYTKRMFDDKAQDKELVYTYDETEERYMVFYVVGDYVVIREDYNSAKFMYDGKVVGEDWCIYKTTEGGKENIEIRRQDLTGDGADELIVETTDDMENTWIYIGNTKNINSDFEPYYINSVALTGDTRSNKAFLYSEYANVIYRKVIDECEAAGVKSGLTMPREGVPSVRLASDARYYSEITEDGRLKFTCISENWSYDAYFNITDGCELADVYVTVNAE